MLQPNENSNNRIGKNWLPNVIFIFGSLSIISGIVLGIYAAQYNPVGLFAAVGGVAFGVLLWGLSYIVKAAMIYIQKNTH